MRLLVAELDAALAAAVKLLLEQEHFAVQCISHGDQLAGLPAETVFDMVLLDTTLPASCADGPLRCLLRRWPDTSVILLCADTAVEQRVQGLNAGADDALVKPFVPAELLARVNALARRRNRQVHDEFALDDLQVNRVSHQVKRAGRFIELSPKEYALLEFLLRSPGKPVPRNTIIEEVWRMHPHTITNVVDVYINYLRRKIDYGSDRPLIRTIRGVGYQIGGNHFHR